MYCSTPTLQFRHLQYVLVKVPEEKCLPARLALGEGDVASCQALHKWLYGRHSLLSSATMVGVQQTDTTKASRMGRCRTKNKLTGSKTAHVLHMQQQGCFTEGLVLNMGEAHTTQIWRSCPPCCGRPCAGRPIFTGMTYIEHSTTRPQISSAHQLDTVTGDCSAGDADLLWIWVWQLHQVEHVWTDL